MTPRSSPPPRSHPPPRSSPPSKKPKDVAKALLEVSEPLRKPLPSTLSVGRKEEKRFIREDIKDRQQRRKLQKIVAPQIVWLTIGWLVGVFIIIVLSGFGNAFCWFKISDRILLVLLGTATTNVLGLFFILAKHLFPKSSDH